VRRTAGRARAPRVPIAAIIARGIVRVVGESRVGIVRATTTRRWGGHGVARAGAEAGASRGACAVLTSLAVAVGRGAWVLPRRGPSPRKQRRGGCAQRDGRAGAVGGRRRARPGRMTPAGRGRTPRRRGVVAAAGTRPRPAPRGGRRQKPPGERLPDRPGRCRGDRWPEDVALAPGPRHQARSSTRWEPARRSALLRSSCGEMPPPWRPPTVPARRVGMRDSPGPDTGLTVAKRATHRGETRDSPRLWGGRAAGGPVPRLPPVTSAA
jgi:hypothetical protein